MSEKLFRFLLGELKTVRLVCQGSKLEDDGKRLPCGVVHEVPLERLKDQPLKCSTCNTEFCFYNLQGQPASPFAPLAKAIQDLLTLDQKVQVEFVLPDVD